MERLIAIWCPSLASEGERGEEVRGFSWVLEAVGEICPWVDAVSLGVCTLPARGPSRFFGGEKAVVEKLSTVLGAGGGGGGGVAARIGVAEGLFASLLASRAGVVVPAGEVGEFLAPWSIAVLRRPELAAVLPRLGITTLGQFGALPARHVLARFGADGAACHRVARGEVGELPGLRDPSMARRLATVREHQDDGRGQPDFFGGFSEADVRAARSFSVLQNRLGVDAVLVGAVREGRSPRERGLLVPWGGLTPGSRRSSSPPAPVSGVSSLPPSWPGRLPSPSPVSVFSPPFPAEILDGSSRVVEVDGRGLLTGPPACLAVGGGPWVPVLSWAGPWPVVESGWWVPRRRAEGRAAGRPRVPRRRAYLQVVAAGGAASLAVFARGRWWLEGAYD